jgi:hypothetical protein
MPTNEISAKFLKRLIGLFLTIPKAYNLHDLAYRLIKAWLAKSTVLPLLQKALVLSMKTSLRAVLSLRIVDL